MKWINKGHELDGMGNIIQSTKNIYIFGAGNYGKMLFSLIHKDYSILGFLDNDLRKTEFCGLPVYDAKSLSVSISTNFIIIVAAGSASCPSMVAQMEKLGYKCGVNLFTIDLFFSLYGLFVKNKVFLPSISFLPTTKCNLHCEACLNFSTYNSNQIHRSLSELKRDLDLFFSCVDYILLVHISGGEPMLYPQLKELLIYLSKTYGSKIGKISTTTNGTVLPSREICEVIHNYDIEVALDDYRSALSGVDKRFQEIEQRFKEMQVNYYVNCADSWIDLAPMTTDHSTWNDQTLCNYFDACHVPFQELRDGKLYSCNYASYAIVAGLSEEAEEDTYDLKSFTSEFKAELVEFRLGYNNKGYTNFCKYCSGYVNINKNIVPVAKQKLNTNL